MRTHRTLAPAKVNLGLFVGPTRPQDSRHELVSVMQSISLADELTLQDAPPGVDGDQVICPGVPGPAHENLAAIALRAFRAATGWSAPPQALTIAKHIPVAGGLAGGSADAAATLRLARHASGLGDERLLRELGASLGADVPAQITPGRWLASGAGERLQELPQPTAPFVVLVLPALEGLSTAAVYAEADRLELCRTGAELEELHARLLIALGHGAPLPAEEELLHNDLQAAALSLRPDILATLHRVRDAGAHTSVLSGSGPTVLGLFPPGEGADEPEHEHEPEVEHEPEAAQPGGGLPGGIRAQPVDGRFARVVAVGDGGFGMQEKVSV
jgi:4-diphosphocytidyl-2-C-methyl-D-erythritol kinase